MPGRMSFALPNSQIPVQGPAGINGELNFVAVDNVTGDLALEQASGTLDFIQSIWIDNSLNTKSLSIIFSGTGQKITVKAGRQGIYPVIASNGSLSWRATSVAAAVIVPVIFMNVQQPYFQWDAV